MQKPNDMSRRDFMKNTAATAVSGAAASSVLGNQKQTIAAEIAKTPSRPGEPLPTIQLGAYQVSRLVAGANPLSGYSYQGSHATNCMKEYFTLQRRVEYLQRCERLGITAHQFSTYEDSEYIRVARDRGVNMHYWGLHSDIAAIPEAIKSTQPIGLVHHGGVTDRLFAEGKQQQVHDFVKAVHDHGIMAGVSAHNPDCIKRIADEGWEVDYFMACFYFLTRERFPEAMEKAEPMRTLDMSHYTWFEDDPAVMTAVIRQVKQPCFGFKILAGGRACHNQRQVHQAFETALTSIKPIDGVIVGMFPRYVDEIALDVEAARRYGKIPAAGGPTS
jgi:hypothetical protein